MILVFEADSESFVTVEVTMEVASKSAVYVVAVGVNATCCVQISFCNFILLRLFESFQHCFFGF